MLHKYMLLFLCNIGGDMIKSQPIKTTHEIHMMKTYLLNERSRDYLLFVLGINIPMKLQELLELKCCDLVFKDGCYQFIVNDYTIYLNKEDSSILKRFVATKSPDDYIFESMKTKSPLTRQQFHRILSAASTAIGCKHSIGPQALKKTFAYHAYHQGIHIFDLMHILGHNTKSETYRFIDVNPPDHKTIQINL